MKIAFQGEKGAYSEHAIFKHYGKKVTPIGFEFFDQVFKAIKKGRVDQGFIPVENTIAGSVTANYDLLLRDDVKIIGEVYLNITPYLLSKKGNKLSNVKFALSHPHSLDQCRKFLKKHKIRPVPKYDTAGAAKIVKENNKDNEAAIASELCADIYDLDILAKGIETNKHNTTKFFIIVKKSKVPKNLKKEKTSIVFKSKHYPGALVNCLQRLAKNGINLTKLESRPNPRNPWEYFFYADFEGGTDDENVKLTLSEMEASAIFIKVLGSYPKGKSPK